MSERPMPWGSSLGQNPRLDDWIRIERADTVTVRTGKVELGQGILTAVAMIAADELDVALHRIRIETADSARPPHEGMTVGSGSIEQSGAAVRQAAAEARRLLVDAAAARLGVPKEDLSVADGQVVATRDRGRVSYWELQGGKPFGTAIGQLAVPKAPALHRVVGKKAQRVDLQDKLLGVTRFVQDLSFPGMLHARVVRPPSQRATLLSCDLGEAEAMPGVVAVVRDGSFLAVIAEREEQAVAAARTLLQGARFERRKQLGQQGLHDRLAQNVFGSYPLVDGTPTQQPVPPIESSPAAVHTVAARYTRPYLMHASIGPSAAAAVLENDAFTVYAATQGVVVLAPALANVLGVEPSKVRVVHVEGPGCYGHNGADDAALEAALCARRVPGRHVLLKWTRQDEHAFEPYGPAMRVDMQAAVDAEGRIVQWSHDVYSGTHIGRAMPMGKASALVAAQQLEKPFVVPGPRPFLMPEVGLHRNAVPPYRVPHARIVKHLSAETPLRTSSLRGLGAFMNVFAVESMMDELAAAAGSDPVAFRLAHLPDPRGRAVLEAVAARVVAWGPVAQADPQRPRGRGFAYSRYENHKCYAAVAIEVEVDLASYTILPLRAAIAADAGQIIDPDGLENQLEGGLIQAASFTLEEQVGFDEQGITTLDWESYPILRFDRVPAVETVLIDRPEERSLGAGEATTGPTSAALANAVCAATGVRLRDTPFTPARLRGALFR
ncbi:MAG: molybdopterin cofactor-binding domain-containing protein [Polyangiales bacterium]